MLHGCPPQSHATNMGVVENNNNNNIISLISSSDGMNTARQPGRRGKKLRSTAALHQQKHPRSSQNTRLLDHNKNNIAASPAAQAGTELHPGTQAVHHLKQGTKIELLRSKSGRLDRGTLQPGGQSARSVLRHSQMAHNPISQSRKARQVQTPGAAHSTKRKGNVAASNAPSPQQLPPRQQKKPLHSSSNVKMASTLPTDAVAEDLREGDKVYAGAKFSEPPSPSVLPKPPSHWVGENEPQQSNRSREQMTCHLKSLLKVQEKS